MTSMLKMPSSSSGSEQPVSTILRATSPTMSAISRELMIALNTTLALVDLVSSEFMVNNITTSFVHCQIFFSLFAGTALNEIKTSPNKLNNYTTPFDGRERCRWFNSQILLLYHFRSGQFSQNSLDLLRKSSQARSHIGNKLLAPLIMRVYITNYTSTNSTTRVYCITLPLFNSTLGFFQCGFFRRPLHFKTFSQSSHALAGKTFHSKCDF